MAGDWIKMRVDLKEDPSVFKLAEILEVDELHIVGALFCFWSWADKHAVDGVVDGATSRLVDKVSCVKGFTDAMVQVGWIAATPNGIKIPNFDRHNGESAKERGLKNARQARWRANKDANVDATPPTKTSTNASTREEKRREEINTNESFERFWSVWPASTRKTSKGMCLKSWNKAKADLICDLVIAHVEQQKASREWTKSEGEFVPAPLVYLNQRRWEGADAQPKQNQWAGSI